MIKSAAVAAASADGVCFFPFSHFLFVFARRREQNVSVYIDNGAGAKQMCTQFILHHSDAYLFIAF